MLTLALFAAIFALTYLRMSVTVKENVEAADNLMVASSSGSGATIQRTRKKEPNSLLLVVNIRENTVTYISDVEYYDNDFIIKIVKNAFDTAPEYDTVVKAKLDGVYLAYKITAVPTGSVKIAVYDYTSLMENMRTLGVVLALFYLLSVVGLFFIFYLYSKRTVAPIEEAFIKQQELVANASHELKTPITIISTSLSVIGSTENAESQKKWLDNVGYQTQRMGKLVNDMLDLARIEQQETVLTKVNVSEILEKALLTTDMAFFENQINVYTDVDKELMIDAEPNNIEKLIYSLIENALKYTPKRGSVWVKSKREKRNVVISVKNTGEGVPADKLPKIFDRFYKADESHNSISGSKSFGLGLAIAKSIVDSFGGTITANSKYGEYMEFVITFKAV